MTDSRWTTALGLVTSAVGALADPHVLAVLPQRVATPLVVLGAVLAALGPSLAPPKPPSGGGGA